MLTISRWGLTLSWCGPAASAAEFQTATPKRKRGKASAPGGLFD